MLNFGFTEKCTGDHIQVVGVEGNLMNLDAQMQMGMFDGEARDSSFSYRMLSFCEMHV